MLDYKPNMTKAETQEFERQLSEQFDEHKQQTEQDAQFRIQGVKGTRGSSSYQFVGYQRLQEFYRGDQWDHDEPAGASQKTDNYCATIVDNFSSLLFDAPVEIHCPSQDPVDPEAEMMAEIKEKLINRVYQDNAANELVFPELSKVGSLFGDGFIKGPMLDKNDSENKKDWKISFFNVDNPANIRPIFMDENYGPKLYGFIDNTAISPMSLERNYGARLRARGVDIAKLISKFQGPRVGYRSVSVIAGQQSYQRMIFKYEYWTDKIMAIFIEDKLVDWWWHNWGFVPLQYIKNIHSPNYAYGKSDIEDAIDPQLFYTRTNNDLANALRYLSTINLKGKNLDGMEVLVHGLSKIFNIPEDGELDSLPRSGDPYASGNFVDNRRRAILDVTGLSESLLSSMGSPNISGRAMSVALQSVIRKLNPRIRRYEYALRNLNENILKLMELYWPETKMIIQGDYSNEVSIISTLLRNIVDEMNKLQGGVQSLTTTQRNMGIPQPLIEQKLIKRDLSDPILGPQIARQPGLLHIPAEGGTPGTPGSNGQDNPNPAPGNLPNAASAQGAVNANNQQGNAVAPPTVNP